MESKPLKFAAPDRLATEEEVRRATQDRCERTQALCGASRLVCDDQPSDPLALLSSEELEWLFSVVESETGNPIN